MNIWKSLTQDKALAEFLLRHLLKKIDRSCLISEVTDRNTSKTYNEVNHEPLSAIVALRLCFGTKEMESIVESEFARYTSWSVKFLYTSLYTWSDLMICFDSELFPQNFV